MFDQQRKICFVQPSNDYQIKAHKHALALTFPYLIGLLSLDKSFSLCLYVEDKSTECFEDFLHREQPHYVLITANTATFPRAVRFGTIAQCQGCIVLLGGIFATLNADLIADRYPCFDRIVKGLPTMACFDQMPAKRVVDGERRYDIDFRLSDILNLPLFKCYREDAVCYEITFGCEYNCNFCTMRQMWNQQGVCSRRMQETLEYDLPRLRRWERLKIIDDDLLQSRQTLAACEFRGFFSQVVAETRIDRINETSINILHRFGITHLIMGVESFETRNLISSSKTAASNWERQVFKALDLCRKYGIVARPVLQILYPDMSKSYLRSIRPFLREWTPENGIELFFSFFTPHPGLPLSRGIAHNLLTYDLSRFDHLTPVYMPDGYNLKDVFDTLDTYNELVETTRSAAYNPYIHSLSETKEEYAPFFE